MGFSNVTLGTGDLLINNVTVGFLSGDVKYGVDKHILDFEAPVPGQGATMFLQGSETIREEVTLKAGFAEINAANFAHAVGEDPITVVTAAPVTVTMGLVGDGIKTLAVNFNGTGFSGVQLGGPTVTSLVVKNAAEAVTYVVNTDYFLDAVTGRLYRNPAGAIGATDTLHLSYGYTPVATNQVSLGTNFAVNNVMVDFIHTRKSGKKIFIKMWIARAKGKFEMTLHQTTWNISEFEFSAIPDFTNNPTSPMGYFKEEA